MKSFLGKKVVGAVLMCALGLFTLGRVVDFEPGRAERFGSYLMYPLLMAQSHVVTPFKDYWASRRERVRLLNSHDRLEQECLALKAQLVALQATQDYMQDTAEARSFLGRYDATHAVIAQVLVKHLSDQSHFIIIDAGADKGITQDMVAVFQNFLVGRVVQVYPWYSKVVLISDKSCHVAAYCQETKATGIYQGLTTTTAASLNFVPHLQEVRVGDTLISSGDGLVFPKGFGVGRVASAQQNGLYHEVAIEPVLDIQALKYVVVMSKGSSGVTR